MALTSVIVMVGPARVPPSLVLRALRAPMAFIVASGLSVAVSVGAQAPGEGGAGPSAYGRWGPLAVTPESLEAAVGLTAHAVAGTLAVLVLASTTPMVDLLAALRRLRGLTAESDGRLGKRRLSAVPSLPLPPRDAA